MSTDISVVIDSCGLSATNKGVLPGNTRGSPSETPECALRAKFSRDVVQMAVDRKLLPADVMDTMSPNTALQELYKRQDCPTDLMIAGANYGLMPGMGW